MPFKSIGLSDELVQGILATGYTAPTEIQAQAIPTALAGKDIIGCAQTGTGKTAAFVLPLLHQLSQKPTSDNRSIQSLILTPTRELALQIDECVRDYGRFMEARSLAVYGGANINTQLRQLKRGVDIVIATPGRLLDLLSRRAINLRQIEVLIVDEADRMFDMGFIKDVQRIIQVLPEKRQTLLFSATMSRDVKALAKQIQKSPKLIQIGQQHNPIETISQSLIYVEKERKVDLLLHLLKTTHMYSVLIFSRTKYGADKIRRKLHQANVEAVAIHSNRTQSQRQAALNGFKAGKFQVLVATDIAARGIDVDGITHVINYDVPGFPEDYVHRIGRTGRATKTGDAITFVSTDEKKTLRKIETFIGKKIPVQKLNEFNTYEKPKPAARPAKRDLIYEDLEAEDEVAVSNHPLFKKAKPSPSKKATTKPSQKDKAKYTRNKKGYPKLAPGEQAPAKPRKPKKNRSPKKSSTADSAPTKSKSKTQSKFKAKPRTQSESKGTGSSAAPSKFSRAKKSKRPSSQGSSSASSTPRYKHKKKSSGFKPKGKPNRGRS